MRKLAVISGFDSQFKWGGELAKKFFAKNYSVEFFCPDVRPNQISDEQLRSYDIPFRIHWCKKSELFETLRLADFDVVLFSLPAGLTEEGTLCLQQTFDRMAQRFPHNPAVKKRPVIVAGFVGVNYENRIGSVVSRRLADIVLANSDEERAYFEDVATRLGLKQPRFVTSGLGLIDSTRSANGRSRSDNNSKLILFAAQPTVPKTKSEKVYLLVRLWKLAYHHPDWTVVIKPRHRPEEQTFHKDEHHLESLFRDFFAPQDAPSNFHFDYRPISRQLEETGLLLTISSTAALEAYGRGVPFGILTDFGIKEPYGAEFFSDCGALTTFPELSQGYWPRVDPEWARRNVAYSNENFGRVIGAVEELLQKQEQSGGMLPVASSTYDSARLEAMRFVDTWRTAQRKVAWIQRLTSGVPRKQGSNGNGKPSTWRRKTRKFFRHPVAFVKDSRYLR